MAESNIFKVEMDKNPLGFGGTVPCKECDTLTPHTGTALCNHCWELIHRIRHTPEIARKILARLDEENANEGA